jgi:hypothetical protein
MNASILAFALLILANCIYFVVKARANRRIEPSNNNEEQSRASTAMLFGALLGFLASSCATWLYLRATGRFVVLGNQYAGPPGVMTCAIFGLLGLIPGSMIGLAFGRKREKVEKPHNQAL